MIYGYVRVSSDKQTTENQRFEIRQFSARNNISVDKWVEETISSGKELEKRKLGKLLKRLQKSDILIASELSRLGRNLLQVMGILSHCMTNEIHVWTIKDNYRLGTDIQSKVLAFAFSLSAEIEKQMIQSRTREALARLKAEGKVLGRPKGSMNKAHKLDGRGRQVRNLLSKGIPKRTVARLIKVNVRTLNDFIRRSARAA